MSEHAPDRLWSGIEITKIIAGTLAAVTAAVIGSFLGVAGTLAGAAVASVVGSVGTEIYQKSLNRGARRLSTIAPTFVKAPAAVGTPEVAAATEEDLPSHTVPETEREHKRQVRWGRIAVLAGAVFVLAMGAIWASEKAFGEPLSTKVGVTDTTGTTLGNAVGNNSSDDRPAPGPSAEPSGQPSTDATGEAEPTSTEPTTDPTDTTTEPTTAPTTAPTDQAPVTPTDPAEQPDQQDQQQDQQQPNQDVAPDPGTTE